MSWDGDGQLLFVSSLVEQTGQTVAVQLRGFTYRQDSVQLTQTNDSLKLKEKLISPFHCAHDVFLLHFHFDLFPLKIVYMFV